MKCPNCGYQFYQDCDAAMVELKILHRQLDQLEPSADNEQQFKRLMHRVGELERELGL